MTFSAPTETRQTESASASGIEATRNGARAAPLNREDRYFDREPFATRLREQMMLEGNDRSFAQFIDNRFSPRLRLILELAECTNENLSSSRVFQGW